MTGKSQTGRIAGFALVVLSALAATACGMRGDLERPPPIWGDPPEQSEDGETGGED